MRQPPDIRDGSKGPKQHACPDSLCAQTVRLFAHRHYERQRWTRGGGDATLPGHKFLERRREWQSLGAGEKSAAKSEKPAAIDASGN